jgi:glyoxylase-like metal-dependent hydrolase (beta-lactamase superfamily II)
MIERFTGGFVQTNSYLISTPDGAQLLIDAPEGVAKWLADKGIRPAAVLLTHQHYDHVQGAAELSALGIPIHAWVPYSPALTLEQMVRGWGLPISVAPYTITNLLEGTERLEIAGLEIELLHVPGHSSDSVAFHLHSQGEVFGGDTLFAGGIGRTDLPGGDHDQLITGIQTKLLPLAAETRVFPGHGPATTIGAERAGNPYLEG